MKAVAVNDADVAALNFHIACYLARRSYSAEIEIPTQPYEALDIALAVGEGDPKNFLAKINPALEEILTSGRVLDIEAKWLS